MPTCINVNDNGLFHYQMSIVQVHMYLPTCTLSNNYLFYYAPTSINYSDCKAAATVAVFVLMNVKQLNWAIVHTWSEQFWMITFVCFSTELLRTYTVAILRQEFLTGTKRHYQTMGSDKIYYLPESGYDCHPMQYIFRKFIIDNNAVSYILNHNVMRRFNFIRKRA